MSALVNTTRIGMTDLVLLRRSFGVSVPRRKAALSYAVLMFGLLFSVAIVQVQDNSNSSSTSPQSSDPAQQSRGATPKVHHFGLDLAPAEAASMTQALEESQGEHESLSSLEGEESHVVGSSVQKPADSAS